MNTGTFYRRILVLLLLGFASASSAESLLRWDGQESRLDLRPYLSMAIDQEKTLTAEEILARPNRLTFRPLLESSPSLGFVNDKLWFRFQIRHDSSQDLDVRLGSIRPEHSRFTVYLSDGQKILARHALGTLIPFHERVIPTRINLAPFVLSPGQTYTVLFELESSQSISMEFSLMTPRQADREENIAENSLFFYFGSMLLFSAYSLIMAIMLRQKAYLYYSCFGLAMILATGLYSGFLELGGWTTSFIRGSADSWKIILLPWPFAILYCLRLFHIGENNRLMQRVSYGLIALDVLVIVIFLMVPGSYDLRGGIPTLQLVNLLFCIALSLQGWRTNRPGAKIQTIGWLLFLVLTGIWTLGNQGIIEKNYWVAFSIVFGNMLEMLIGIIALGTYVRGLENNRFQAELKEKESHYLRALVMVVCHDIANPLSVITVLSNLLRSQAGENEKIRSFTQRIDKAAQHIVSIVDQVRRMQAVHMGKYQPRWENVLISDLLQEVEFLFMERAREKGVRLILPSLTDPLYVRAEKAALVHDVLSNFVSNALKFSTEGSAVTLQVQASASQVTIATVDQGIGMSPQLVSKLFDPNSSTSRQGTAREQGTGFGMMIAKTFVEVFGGQLEIESREKKTPDDVLHGTVIRIVLPRVFPQQDAPIQRASA